VNVRTKGWLQRVFDLDLYRHAHQNVSNSGTRRGAGSFDPNGRLHSTPLLVAVGPKSGDTSHLLAVFAITNAITGAFEPVDQWSKVGSVTYPTTVSADASAFDSGGGLGSGASATGCNRVRVHQSSRRAAYSCFGGGAGHDVVGFVDLTDPQNPSVIGTVPFVSEQPTGMLMLGDALFVAGELDIMVFDMGKVTPAAPAAVASEANADVQLPHVVATCGEACAKVGKAKGQNFHSIAYKLTAAGRHLIFISAQIDNAIGCVEIVDPQIIALIQATANHRSS
jgi:hypothetical protein